MLIDIPEKFDDYVSGSFVSSKIPDGLLEELKEFDEKYKDFIKRMSGEEVGSYFKFPR